MPKTRRIIGILLIALGAILIWLGLATYNCPAEITFNNGTVIGGCGYTIAYAL